MGLDQRILTPFLQTPFFPQTKGRKMQRGITLFLGDGRIAVTKLRRWSWLYRSFLIADTHREFRIDYGAGSEAVTVWLERRLEGGQWIADRRYLQTIERRDIPQVPGYHFWFQPAYVFALGGFSIRIDVRIWPWLTMKGFMLKIDEMVAYSEGVLSGLPSPFGQAFGDVWDRELDSFPGASA